MITVWLDVQWLLVLLDLVIGASKFYLKDCVEGLSLSSNFQLWRIPFRNLVHHGNTWVNHEPQYTHSDFESYLHVSICG